MTNKELVALLIVLPADLPVMLKMGHPDENDMYLISSPTHVEVDGDEIIIYEGEPEHGDSDDKATS